MARKIDPTKSPAPTGSRVTRRERTVLVFGPTASDTVVPPNATSITYFAQDECFVEFATTDEAAAWAGEVSK